MGFEAACDLGRRFRQDAIFWVSGNRVGVTKCGPDRQRADIGPYAYRFAVEEAHALEKDFLSVAWRPGRAWQNGDYRLDRTGDEARFQPKKGRGRVSSGVTP